MNILFTICARAGSKGVKSKNTRQFCGKPLVYYTVAAYEAYKAQFDEAELCLAVNTDSKVLIYQLEKTGADYISVERKESLAGDIVAKKDVIKDTLRETERQKGINFDFVVDLDLTSPIRTVRDIEQIVKILTEDQGADIVYSVTEARRSPFFNMVTRKEDGYFATVMKTDFVARQQTLKCYDMNASIYAYRREYLLSDRVNDRKALVWVMEDTGILDIDSEHDLELMEIIAGHLWMNKSEYLPIYTIADKYDNS